MAGWPPPRPSWPPNTSRSSASGTDRGLKGRAMRVVNDGVGIEYEVAGEGRPVILLHGFPDSHRLWRHQVPVLVDAGFQVITPDLRGYGASDKPDGVDPYHLL